MRHVTSGANGPGIGLQTRPPPVPRLTGRLGGARHSEPEPSAAPRARPVGRVEPQTEDEGRSAPGRADARHSLPFSSYLGTVGSVGVAGRERQIVQSELDLVKFSP